MATVARHGGSSGGPTVLRVLLGAHLRRLREAKGISRQDAGWAIRSSESKISRMELGRVGFKERDVEDLLTLYGLADVEDRAQLLALARDASTPGWWHQYVGAFPSWFTSYLGLESAAAVIRTYEVQFVPGLLQTRDYARAVVRLAHGKLPPEEIEKRVELRMARQQALTRGRPAPPRLSVVVDEAVLRRPIGGSEILREQIEALLRANEQPHVRVQVLPFHVGGHSAAGGSFTLLHFPDRDLSDVVYVEQLNSALYLDKREDVEGYVRAMERLCVEAEPPDRSERVLRTLLRDLR